MFSNLQEKESDKSAICPFIKGEDMVGFLENFEGGELALIKGFRDWVKKTFKQLILAPKFLIADLKLVSDGCKHNPR